MKSLVLDFPDSVEVNEQEVKTLLAARLFENGTLSMAQAAEFAGYSKRTFMELLGNYGVSIFDISEDELEKDILNAKSYHI
jgi:predicted HTH domain antitoxin